MPKSTKPSAAASALSEARNQIDEDYARRVMSLDRQIDRASGRAAKRERRRHMGRAIIIGEFVLAAYASHPVLYETLLATLNLELRNPHQRRLFGFPTPDDPLPTHNLDDHTDDDTKE